MGKISNIFIRNQRRKRSIVTDLIDYGLNVIDDKSKEKKKIKYKSENKNIFEIWYYLKLYLYLILIKSI